MAEAMVEPAAEAGAKQFLTFALGGERYAIPAGEVREVIRPPATVRVPHTPPSLLGLCNLRGTVLPVASLSGLLGRGDEGMAETARVIVLDVHSLFGVLVDRISLLVTVEPGEIGRTDEASGHSIAGAFTSGREVTRILDMGGLLSQAYSEIGRRGPAATERRRGVYQASNDTARVLESEDVLLGFDVGGQEYALPLEHVRRIVALPPAISVVPHVQSMMLGVISLEGRLLPLVSLAALLGLAQTGFDVHRAIVVTAIGSTPVGLVVDGARAILRVPSSAIDPVPGILASRQGEAEIQAVCRLDGGKRLVSVLSPEKLFNNDLIRHAVVKESGGIEADMDGSDTRGEEQFVIFRLGEEEYGLPIAAVDEVTRVPPELTRVPKTPPFVEGVINLRGTVVPVIDQRRRFDLAPMGANDQRRIIIVRIDQQRTGFIVDSVSKILKASLEQIGTAPDITEEQGRLVSRVVTLETEGRMILLLDPKELLDSTERRLLAVMKRTGQAKEK